MPGLAAKFYMFVQAWVTPRTHARAFYEPSRRSFAEGPARRGFIEAARSGFSEPQQNRVFREPRQEPAT